MRWKGLDPKNVFQALAHNRHALEKMLPKMAIWWARWTGVCLVGVNHVWGQNLCGTRQNANFPRPICHICLEHL